MTSSFDQLGLPDQMVRTLRQRGITEPFPIQSAAIPDALAGRDVSGRAPTGSGKTLAFGLPTLARIGSAQRSKPTGLALAPTRELAQQIVEELQPMAAAMSRNIVVIHGGVGYGPQKSALRRGVDLVVATPGRLEDLIEQGLIDLSAVETVILDEADRMADMGFIPAVRRILDLTPSDRQTLLFSATLDGAVAQLSKHYQDRPVRHDAAGVDAEGGSASHHFWLVDHQERAAHAASVITSEGPSIVFTRTRRGADRLAKQLGRFGVEAAAIHGGRSQSQRNRALDAFAKGRVSALIGTDVAARGIHVDAVAAVVHYDPAGDPKDYVHRSGRTARAGAEGKVVSFVTNEQRREVTSMQKALDRRVTFEDPARAMAEGIPSISQQPDRSARHARGSQTNGAARTPDSLYVANLPWAATDDDLRALFTRFGEVRESTVIRDRRSGRSRGFGFVEMAPGSGEPAIRELHGSDFDGRDLTVRVARPRGTSS